MDHSSLNVLEYNKIIDMLKTHLVSDIGYEYADAASPSADLSAVERMLTETEEAQSVYRRTGHIPINAFPDLRQLLLRVHAINALSVHELLGCAECLKASRRAKESIAADDSLTVMLSYANRLLADPTTEREIDRCIISEDDIADHASPELARIRRQMRITDERMRDKLNSMIKSTEWQQYLQEPIVTVRNGHFALPVKAEYRSRVNGYIHDQSGSGATLFIEPAAVVELGNELRRLKIDENHEIEKILSGLTALVAQHAEELAGSLEILGKLDYIFARCLIASEMDAIRPKMNDRHRIDIVSGRHPLLKKETVVPISVHLGDNYSSLIITGPNTGGKTVTLKTVGLFCLMAMSGMFVPADRKTELTVFDNVFADIGDEQSIEQSLSTFSSHMSNTVKILGRADASSLVLLDELGAGTDPVEGAALAQAILEELLRLGALTMATTHYSELKAFAMTRTGMQNASMEFDVERLCPTYRLIIGIPGKSNAFEISARLGLSETIIQRAADYLENRDIVFEDVLSGAERARKDAENERLIAAGEREKAEQIRRDFEAERNRLEAEKARIKEKAREDARKIVASARSEMDEVIRSLREMPELDKKQRERLIQQSRDRAREYQTALTDERPVTVVTGEGLIHVDPGDSIFVASLQMDATVLKSEDAKGDVAVQIGAVKTTVKLKDLSPSVKKEKKKPSVKIELHEPDRSFLELDIRGKTVDEAEIEIDRFIDDARLTGVNSFSVIHGKGSGALRAGVQLYLKQHPAVKTYRIGAYGEGDAGVTVVTLK